MANLNARFAGALFLSLCFAGSILALQGVVEQTITLPDAIQANWGSSIVQLEADEVDAIHPSDLSWEVINGPGSWSNQALGSSTVDAQRYGEATAEVGVTEGLDWYENGNHSDGDGIQSTRGLAASMDIDDLTLSFTPADNPYGIVHVEVVQKTYNTIWAHFDSNGADDQTKYFYFRTANTMVDGSLQETTFQWSQSTASASSTGVGVQLKLDGEVQANASWSETVDQGVGSFQYLASARLEALKLFEFHGNDLGVTETREITIDCGFNWNIYTVDEGGLPVYPDRSVLEGVAYYYTVFGFGEITVIKNTDGTTTDCPRTFHYGTDIGNPELTDDREVESTVSYVSP